VETVERAVPASPRPRRRFWRGVLLVTLPLLAVAVALRLAPKCFHARIEISASSGAAGAATEARAFLLDNCWQFVQTLVKTYPAAGYLLDGDCPQGRLCVRLLAPSRQAGVDWVGDFTRFWDAAVNRRVAAARAEVSGRQARTEKRLAEFEQQLAAADSELRTSAEPAAAADTPITRLTSEWVGLQAEWEEFVARRDRLEETRRARSALVNAPPIRSAYVDPQKREQKYAEHVALSEDLRHLEIQLGQVRTSLLTIGESASASLEELLAAAADISRLAETAAAGSRSPTEQPLLEQTSEKAAEFHHEATLFAQAWTRDLMGLRELNPNPQTNDLLAMHDRLVERVKDFLSASDAAVATLRRRLRSLGEQPGGSASTHVLDASILRRFHDLQTAQRTFTQVAGEMFAADNYLLEAALQSARGLWHRTQSARREVDAALEAEAVSLAIDERNRQIAALSEELNRVNLELLELVETIRAHSLRSADLVAGIPDYLATANLSALARLKVELLQGQVRDLAEDRAELTARDQRAGAWADLRVAGSNVGNLPANLTELARTALLAGAATLLGLIGAFRLIDRVRR